MTAGQVVLAVWAVLVAFVIGSGTNVVIDRLPVELDEPDDLGTRYTTRPWREVFAGRSRCSDCGHDIRWYDNIPVVSWFVLRGRCRDCGTRIDAFHPFIEALIPALGVAAYLAIGWQWPLAVAWWLIPVGVAIAAIDIRTLIVPTRLVWPSFFVLVAITVLAAGIEAQGAWLVSAAVGCATVTLPLGVLWLIHPRGLGFGDVRLAVLLGWGAGFAAGVADERIVAAVFIGSAVLVLSAVAGLIVGLAIVGFRRIPVPFGFAMVGGGLAAVILADRALDFVR